MFRFLGKIAIVGVAHFMVSVLLYYGAVKNLSPLFRSEVLVLYVPAILAFAGYSYLAWRDGLSSYGFPVRLIFTPIIGFSALAISSTCFAMFALNMWGS
jgi:hypothetical protein